MRLRSPSLMRVHGRQTHAPNGFSFVELLVGLAIGLAVISSGLTLYLNSGRSYRDTHALTQMTEDASVALAILRTQIALAGYSNPSGLDSEGRLMRPFSAQSLFGCTGGITSGSIGSAELTQLACQNDPDAPDALVVRYEADTRNTLPTSAGVPTDCLGNSAPKPEGTYHLADNRYFVQQNTLSCRGNGHTVSQPLVDHVVDLDLLYGVTDEDQQGNTRYLSAQSLSAGTAPPSQAPLWRRVRAIRVCVLMRSETPLLDASSTYHDCRGQVRTAPDRHLYRAFSTTVHLPNQT